MDKPSSVTEKMLNALEEMREAVKAQGDAMARISDSLSEMSAVVSSIEKRQGLHGRAVNACVEFIVNKFEGGPVDTIRKIHAGMEAAKVKKDGCAT